MRNKLEIKKYIESHLKSDENISIDDIFEYISKPKFFNWYNNIKTDIIDNLEPKEFYYCKIKNDIDEWIFQKKDHIRLTSNNCCISGDYCGEGPFITNDENVLTLRLATDEEKQRLIDKVKQKFNLRYNEVTKNFEKVKNILD